MIANALKLPGWMLEGELQFLAEEASRHFRVVELGSFRGRSARAMADNLPPGGVLYCVDPWIIESYDLPLTKIYWDEIGGKPDGWLLEDFKKNMSGLNNYIPLRMTSLEAAKYAADYLEPFDMIFIDAGHDYKSVREDILAWRPLIKSGGRICGHDYDKEYWSEVVRAV